MVSSLNSVFDKAIQAVLKHEGGYVNNPKDPGGETNFGISKKSYPDLDIPNLTKEDAIAIYKRDFWDKQPYKLIVFDPLCIKAFDMSINIGPKSANKSLQIAVNAFDYDLDEDGVLGPKSLKAINSCTPITLLVEYKHKLIDHYKGLVAKNHRLNPFLKGWIKRALS